MTLLIIPLSPSLLPEELVVALLLGNRELSALRPLLLSVLVVVVPVVLPLALPLVSEEPVVLPVAEPLVGNSEARALRPLDPEEVLEPELDPDSKEERSN